MADKSVTAIVQARMGSTRLPGKILKLLSGYPILWHVINRIKSCPSITKIIIATTTNPEDNPVSEFCDSLGVSYFRGSENDVLDRYYQASRAFNVGAVARMTADCPLLDPAVINLVCQTYLNNQDNVDYVSNILIRSYPRGLDVEVFSARALDTTWKDATKTFEREHVTPFIYQNPKKFRLLNVKNSTDLSAHRWTVDEPKDFELVQRIYNELFSGGPLFGLQQTLGVFEKDPTLFHINSAIQQKHMGDK